MKILSVYLMIMLVAVTRGFSQKYAVLVPIQKVKSSAINPYLLKEIEKYIVLKEVENKLFKDGFGYVLVSQIKILSQRPIIVSDTMKFAPTLSFYVGLASSYITPDVKYTTSFCESCYPPFYMVIHGHPVLINDEIATLISWNKFSSKSQKALEKLLIPHFRHTLDKDFMFYSIFTKEFYKLSEEKRKKLPKKEIFKEAAFVFNEGRTVTFFQNGSVVYKAFN